MRFSTAFKLLTVATVAPRSATSFVSPSRIALATRVISTTASGWTTPGRTTTHSASTTQRFMSSSEPELKHIGWEEMDSILDEYEELGREESGVIVLDVRNEDEIAYTGQLSPNTKTLPLPAIMQYNLCGFPKPTPDETLVFSCAAGIRSVHAAKFAAAAGYSKLVNYVGGANEWFNR
jgi:rhodanese-related sulfurtransferase